MKERRILIAGIVCGTLLRVVHTYSSLGTLDAFLWFRWVELIERVGILKSYAYSDMMNHPPLALLVALFTNRLGVVFGLEFQDSFRLLQAGADIVSAYVLTRIASRLSATSWPATPYNSLLFFLSPAAVFISGFHCNSDPLMMMLLLLAVLAAMEDRPLTSGVLIAAAVSIKIVALFSIPLIFMSFRGRQRYLFLLTTVTGGALGFLPGIIGAGPVFVRNVFGYSGMVTGWGLRLLVGWTGLPVEASGKYILLVLVAALFAVWVAEWRLAAAAGALDAARLPRVLGLTYLLVLVLAPGFGVQYLFWLLPFFGILFARRAAVLLHGVVSVFVFALYTGWAQGWPWWYAEGKTATPEISLAIVRTGFVAWIALAIASVAAITRLYRK